MIRGLGRGACHLVVGEEVGDVLLETNMTKCGLAIGEYVSPGAVVQKPGVHWPLRRCKRCWPEEAASAYSDEHQEQLAA